MTQAQSAGLDATKASSLEKQISSLLCRTADEIAHSEALDEEQRSEIYTILSAIQADHRIHSASIEALSQARLGRV
jgi:hypothetical protein